MTGESVLIIEDDGIIAFHLFSILERAGYVPEDPVVPGEDVFDRLSDEPLPDLVLLDAGNPGRYDSFHKTLGVLSQCDVPVLILTTFTDFCESEQVMVSRHAEFLTKPFLDNELLLVVERSLHPAPRDIGTLHECRGSGA